jgi:predicted component of type VI protein secretion system
MEAKLVVVRGKASKGAISLNLPTVIGRSRDVDLTIAHPTVSRRHCELFEDNGVLKIRDLGSLNGTFLGKTQVKESDLRPNDLFSVGPLTFRVLYEYNGEAAGRPRPAKPAKPAKAANAATPADELEIEEELPDFTLMDDLGDDSAEPLLEELEELSEESTTEDSDEPLPARAPAGPATVNSGDSEVLDFLLDDDPKPKKKAGKDQGTDDDDLDQFFKQLG